VKKLIFHYVISVDTSLINEHQVNFEQMDFISHIKGLKILRKYKNDSNTSENKDKGFLNIGFRFAQTYRTVKNSE